MNLTFGGDRMAVVRFEEYCERSGDFVEEDDYDFDGEEVFSEDECDTYYYECQKAMLEGKF